MNKDECKTACDELKLPKGVMMNNNPCYKSGKARCRQDGRHGSKASLICKIGGNQFNLSIILGYHNKMIIYERLIKKRVFPLACAWLTPTDQKNYLGCGDGTFCDGALHGWTCCNDHGGRKQCPLNTPIMCAEKKCADGIDHCCSTDCNDAGGPRLCGTYVLQ